MRLNWIYKRLYLVIVSLILLVSGCAGMTAQERLQASVCATAYALDPVHPSSPCMTMGAQYGYYAPSTPMPPTSNPYWTPTLSMYDLGMTQIVVQQNGAATAQANQLQMERERLEAEERARRQATAAYYAEETAAAFRIQSTANAQATNMQFELNMQGTQMAATAQAQATSTAFQYAVDQQNTAIAAAATNAVLPTHAIWTADAARAQATIQAGEAAKVALAVRRQELKNGIDAFAPWVLLIVGLGVAAWGYMKFVRMRPFERDPFGNRPTIGQSVKDGVVYFMPELAEGSVTKITNAGEVIRWAPVDANQFAHQMRRQQTIEAIKALPSELSGTGKQMINVEFGRQGGGRVTISPAGADSGASDNRLGPVLDEAERKLIEDVNY